MLDNFQSCYTWYIFFSTLFVYFEDDVSILLAQVHIVLHSISLVIKIMQGWKWDIMEKDVIRLGRKPSFPFQPIYIFSSLSSELKLVVYYEKNE